METGQMENNIYDSGNLVNLYQDANRVVINTFAAIAVILVHLIFAHADYSPLERLFAGFCGLITARYLLLYINRKSDSLPAIEFVLLQFYIYFAMPVFFEGSSTMQASFQSLSNSGSVRLALFCTTLFFLTFVITWRLFPEFISTRPNDIRINKLSPTLLFSYGFTSLVIVVVFGTYDQIEFAWYSSMLHLMFSPLSAQILIIYELTKSPNQPVIKIGLLTYSIFMIIVGLLSSRMDFVFMPIVTLALGYYMLYKKLPLKLFVFAFLLIIIVNPAKHAYRELSGYRSVDAESLTLKGKVAAWGESISEVWSTRGDEKSVALKVTASRFDFLVLNATVISQMPHEVPYAYGEPWSSIGINLIPRFMWTDKPNMTSITNDKFNLIFGMTTPEIAMVSTGAYPIIADGYWNFGLAGVVFSAFVSSIFWKIVYNISKTAGRLPYLFAAFMIIYIRPMSSITEIVGTLFQYMIACFVVVKALEVLQQFFPIRLVSK